MSRFKTRYIILAFMLFFATCAVIVSLSSGSNSKKSAQPVSASLTKGMVIISNPNSLSKTAIDSVASLQKTLYDQVGKNISSPQSSYEGTVRNGSLKTTTDDTGYPTTTFLVDIKSIEQSYKVEVDGDSTTDYAALYVFCPAQNELKYADFACVDTEQ